MKVISRGEDDVLVEFENLVRYTDVVGVTAPIQALVSVEQIGRLHEAEEAGRSAARRCMELMGEVSEEPPVLH